MKNNMMYQFHAYSHLFACLQYLCKISFFCLMILFSFPSFSMSQNCSNNLASGLSLDVGTVSLKSIPENEDYVLFDRAVELTVTCPIATPIMVRLTSPLPSADANNFTIVNTSRGRVALKVTLELNDSAKVDGTNYKWAAIGDIPFNTITAASSFTPSSGVLKVPSDPLSKFSAWTLVDTNNGNRIVSGRQFSFPMQFQLLTGNSNTGWRTELENTGEELDINVAALILLFRP